MINITHNSEHKVMTLFSEVIEKLSYVRKNFKTVIRVFMVIFLKTAFRANDFVKYCNEFAVEFLPLNITKSITSHLPIATCQIQSGKRVERKQFGF